MMPVEVRKWMEAASWVRYRRDVAQARADALQQPIHERQGWLSAREHEAAFRRDDRLASAEKKWPKALADFEEEWCKRTRGIRGRAIAVASVTVLLPPC
jgi:hypothetical protein